VLSEKHEPEALAQEVVDIHPLPGRRVARLVHAAGAGAEPMTIDFDSPIYSVHGCEEEGAAFGYNKILDYHALLATRVETVERRMVGRAAVCQSLSIGTDTDIAAAIEPIGVLTSS
jgi:hypothetical protein